jgi:hypothetical protein
MLLRSLLAVGFAAFAVIGSGLIAPTRGHAANACMMGQVPDENGACCAPQDLVAAPDGGSVCSSHTINSQDQGIKIARGFLFGGGAGNFGIDYPNGPPFGSDDDPYFSGSSTRVNPVTTTSATTGAQGLAPGGQVTTLGTGADGHIPIFDLKGDSQRLTVGAYFDFNSIRANYDALTPGASFQRDLYSAGTNIAYDYNRSYLRAKVGGLWGDGTTTDTTARGSFNSTGYQASLTGGHVFPLYDTRTFASRQLYVKAVPTDAKPTGGYFVGLDLSGTVATYHETIGSFTDSSGFINGAENLTTWTVGTRAKLYADILNNGLVWTPYVSVGVNQQVDYSHTLALVAQAGQAADTLQFAAPGQTYGIFQTGFSVLDQRGIRYGIDASYYRSSGVEGASGRAYVRFPLLHWLGISG